MHNHYWAGFITYGCVSSLLQDLRGKEAWLAMADAGWMPWYITTPLAVLGLGIAMWMLRQPQKEEK